MPNIPDKYINSIKQILEWHLEYYVPDFFLNTRITRILDRMGNGNAVELEEKELYCIYECVSNAKIHTPDCGAEKSVADENFDWISPEYQKTKR